MRISKILLVFTLFFLNILNNNVSAETLEQQKEVPLYEEKPGKGPRMPPSVRFVCQYTSEWIAILGLDENEMVRISLEDDTMIIADWLLTSVEYKVPISGYKGELTLKCITEDGRVYKGFLIIN